MKVIALILFSYFLLFQSSIEIKGQSFCQRDSGWVSDSYFVYRNTNDSTDFLIDHIIFKKDTFFKSSFYYKANENKKDLDIFILKNVNKIESFYDSLQRIKKDTLIRVHKNNIKFLDGQTFIDTNLKPFSEERALNQKVFLQKTINEMCTFYEFLYLDMFSSHSQYSYLFRDNYWVVEYDFGEGYKYRLIRKTIANE